MDHVPWFGDVDALVGEVQEFLTGAREARNVDRVLVTVLFTDVVGSTERAAKLGDRRWRALLDTHHAAVRRALDRFRGREVKTTGDGFLATFDGPARAIRCARSIVEDLQRLGLAVKAGLHTGECEIMGDDVGGIAVHTAARVAAAATSGEVLVSSTVKDLVAGAGITFVERGTRTLKGVPGKWRLFAVDSVRP
jgi:class 3 adenylate cyclase